MTDNEVLNKVLTNYFRSTPSKVWSAQDRRWIVKQAIEITEAGGTVAVVHVANEGFRLEMTLPKRKRILKKKETA